jgi:hypothetical protein
VIPIVRLQPVATSPSIAGLSHDPRLDEIEKVITALRKTVKVLREESESKDGIIADLRERLSRATGECQRARIEAIREADQAIRARTRAEASAARLEVAMVELGERQEEITTLRRELMKLRIAAIPAVSQIQRLTKAQREQLRLARDQAISAALLESTRQIMSKADDTNVRTYLEKLTDHAQQGILRIEARRRRWKEIETKQTLAALAAMSLLAEERTDVQAVLPSPFRSVRKERPKPKNGEDEELPVEPMQKPSALKTPSFARMLELIGRVDPPLTEEERLAVIKRKVSPELEEKIIRADKETSPAPLDAVIIRNS